jgi:O-antigen/teichoic acid export membrane protein
VNDAQTDSPSDGRLESGSQERHLALGTLAQQASTIAWTLAMLGITTGVARTRSLAEFGVYGLLTSFTTYLLLTQISVESAAIKSLSEAQDEGARSRAFTIAASLYVVGGLVTGLVVIGVGMGLLGVLNIPPGLLDESRQSLAALGIVMILGWPLKVFQDVLRGAQRFVPAAFAEVAAGIAFACIGGILLATEAPLWSLVAVGGSQPALMGAAGVVAVTARRMRPVFDRASLRAAEVRSFLGLSGTMFGLGITDLVVYSLDRLVLGLFRSVSTIGLYEGPVRAHNLVRQLNGTLVTTVLPAAASYLGAGDAQRARDLLVRGTRYVVAAVVPLTVVLMVLARPILEAWLGPNFGQAGLALTVFVSYWLVASSTAVAAPMLVAAGRARSLLRYASMLAVANLLLSLALTPLIGLEGVVIGTALPNFVIAPVILRLAVDTFGISMRELEHRVWIPAFSLAAVLAGALLAVRIIAAPHGAIEVGAICVAALLAYWAAYAVLWLEPSERLLVRDVGRTLTSRFRTA